MVVHAFNPGRQRRASLWEFEAKKKKKGEATRITTCNFNFSLGRDVGRNRRIKGSRSSLTTQ